MPVINTASDLQEVRFTPEELNKAMQLADKTLSILYLQNTKVGLVRILANQEFTDPADDMKEQRVRAYHKGQLDLLEALIQGCLEPSPVPINTEQQPQPVNPGA